uniref:PH domain-containing protein n=1 Tax=Aplanochytrium stocchinoi TaxID=215587 RepID=A0A7S3LMY6_9STRA
MSRVLKIYNIDGTFNRVDLYPPVRSDEVVNAIVHRQQYHAERAPMFSLYLITTWIRQGDSASGSGSDSVILEFHVRKLAPDDRPLQVKAIAEQEQLKSGHTSSSPDNENQTQGRIRKRITFVFCDHEGEALLRRSGDMEILIGKEVRMSEYKNREKQKQKQTQKQLEGEYLGLESALHHGKEDGAVLSMFLLKRSSRNSREWQRQWCVLHPDGLYHGPAQGTKMTCIPLTHNTVQKSSTLSNCFEVHTAQSVEYFRTKTADDCSFWIEQIQRNIDLASDNELFMLAEYIIADEEKAGSARDEAILEKACESLEGLLSTIAGAKTLIRYSRFDKGKDSSSRADDTGLIALYLNIERALAMKGDIPNSGHSSEDISISPSKFHQQIVQQKEKRSNSHSALSIVSTSSFGSLRLPLPPASFSEWVLQLVEKFIFLNVSILNGQTMIKDFMESASSSDEPENNSKNTPNHDHNHIALLKEMKAAVLEAVRSGLYVRFTQTPEYAQLMATIPLLIA